jgi:glycosyltransferase involved in cell wall biosynthesis
MTKTDMTSSVPTQAEKRGKANPQACRKVLVLASHVVPYGSAGFRLLAQDSRLNIQVAYCSMQGAERGLDPEFETEIQWDELLLEGYPWIHVPNRSLRPGLARFFGLWNPGLWKLIRNGGFDAIVIYTGYMYASFWLAVLAAKNRHVPVIISSDSSTTEPRDGSRWKKWIKPFILGRVYRTIDVLMAGSPAVEELAVRLGMPKERIVIIPSGMNKDEWVARTARFDRRAVRKECGIPDDALVIFCCAKLQPWKRPLDLLRAFATAAVPRAYLVYAGDGPQRVELEQEARDLGVSEHVRILGFVNLSKLPGLYMASDLFVLPSEYDPCPLVVPEALLSGLPVVMSDAILGRLGMIEPGKSGYTYPCGDSNRLAEILRKVSDPGHMEHLKHGVRRQMEFWSSSDLLDSWVRAIDTARQKVQNSRKGKS